MALLPLAGLWDRRTSAERQQCTSPVRFLSNLILNAGADLAGPRIVAELGGRNLRVLFGLFEHTETLGFLPS